jgi:predicted restriction endonuclease
LITIDQDYRIIVSGTFTEAQNSYSLKGYYGKQIILPLEKKFLPGAGNFKWHRENVFRD